MLKVLYRPGITTVVNCIEVNPSTYEGSQQQVYKRAQLTCWPFPMGWMMVLLPLCFWEPTSCLLRGKKHFGISSKFWSEAYQGMKNTSTGLKAEKLRCGAWSKYEDAEYSRFNKNNCKLLLLLHSRNRIASLQYQKDEETVLHLHSNYRDRLLSLASPGHCSLHSLENRENWGKLHSADLIRKIFIFAKGKICAGI